MNRVLLDFPKPDMVFTLMFPIGKQEYSSVKVEKRLSEKRDFKVRDSFHNETTRLVTIAFHTLYH